MKAVRYNIMLNSPSGELCAVINKTPREASSIIQQHIKDEYGLDFNVSYCKIHDVYRGKSKKSFLALVIASIEKIQLTKEQVNDYKSRGIALF